MREPARAQSLGPCPPLLWTRPPLHVMEGTGWANGRRAPIVWTTPAPEQAEASSSMRQLHSPHLLANVEDAKAGAFVFLFTCDAFARAILITLLPLQAYALL